MAIGCLALEEKLHLKTPIVNYPLMAFDNPLFCSTLNAHRFGNSMKMKEFFNPWPRPWDAARRLYVCVVKQARQPGFYLTCGVPDTADGRFDMILLHAFLLLRRTKRDHDRTAYLGQAFFDLMFADMDQNLREMGLGDLAVGKRVKGMAAAFYGRIQAYEDGLAGDEAALVDSLRRNLYRKTEPDDSQLSTVADYMRREAARLDHIDTDRLLRGELDFGPAPAAPEKVPPEPEKKGLGKEKQQ